MSDVTIKYQLDLAVQLIDTTTGNPVDEKQVIFQAGGKILSLLQRGTGLYILMNHGRENMILDVDVAGYLPTQAEVDYEGLSKREPTIEIPLIPKLKPYGYSDLVTIEGTKSGIESIDAIQYNNPLAAVGNYIEPRQILKLFTSKQLSEETYAILHEKSDEFEEFRIAKKVDKLTLRLRNPLVTQVEPEETVNHITRGKADDDGHYLLRIRENGKGSDYLIRYVVNGKVTFVRINLDNPEERRLD